MRHLGGWEEFLQLSFPLEKQELVVVVLLSDEHADLGKHHTVCEHGQKDARNRDGLG